MINDSFLIQWIGELHAEVYPQPPDIGHLSWMQTAIHDLLPDDVETVLDVGCGQGNSKIILDKLNPEIQWTGVTLGNDYQICAEYEYPVYELDMTFLGAIGYYDCIFARHVLEHSVMPLITLREWYRISNKYLLLIAPAPEYWGWVGRNHYSMINKEQLEFLFEKARWEVKEHKLLKTQDEEFLKYNPTWDKNKNKIVEYRYLLEKV